MPKYSLSSPASAKLKHHNNDYYSIIIIIHESRKTASSVHPSFGPSQPEDVMIISWNKLKTSCRVFAKSNPGRPDQKQGKILSNYRPKSQDGLGIGRLYRWMTPSWLSRRGSFETRETSSATRLQKIRFCCSLLLSIECGAFSFQLDFKTKFLVWVIVLFFASPQQLPINLLPFHMPKLKNYYAK